MAQRVVMSRAAITGGDAALALPRPFTRGKPSESTSAQSRLILYLLRPACSLVPRGHSLMLLMKTLVRSSQTPKSTTSGRRPSAFYLLSANPRPLTLDPFFLFYWLLTTGYWLLSLPSAIPRSPAGRRHTGNSFARCRQRRFPPWCRAPETPPPRDGRPAGRRCCSLCVSPARRPPGRFGQ